MSSTNKTTNYNLSQYIGSDKPTYLTDYNGDMFKIDAQMKLNADNVATAIQGATDASTLASTANSTATTANTNANTAIANNATTDAKLNDFMLKFNLSNRITYNSANISFPGSVNYSNIEGCEFTLAKNSDGSIFKLYGYINGMTSGSGGMQILLNNTGLLVDTPYTILPAGIMSPHTTNDNQIYLYVENNKITINWWNYEASDIKATLFPCVYFNADFGDTPQNNS